MKNVRLLFLTSLLISSHVLFNSCTNDTTIGAVENTTNADSDLLARTGVATPENSANPYDQVGSMHNVVIAKVMANSQNLNSTEDYIEYSREVFFDEYSYDPSTTPYPTNGQLKNIINDLEYNFSNIITNSNFTPAGKEQLTIFVDIMLTGSQNSSMDYNTIKAQLLIFEDDLIKNPNISSTEKQNILQVTSVARYSAYYWYNDMLDAIDYNIALPKNAAKRAWWQWLVVGTADALGAIGGAVAGSPTGIVAVGTAVIGAAGASGGAVTVIDYFWPSNP